MNKQLEEALLKAAIAVLMKVATPENLRRAADGILDIVEDAVMKSENKVDDMLLLPMCNVIRATFSIKDNDDAKEIGT